MVRRCQDPGKHTNGLSVPNLAEGDMSIGLSEELLAAVALRFSRYAAPLEQPDNLRLLFNAIVEGV
jgi:hypothetical protein